MTVISIEKSTVLTSLTEVGKLVGAPEAVPLGVPPERHAVTPAYWAQDAGAPGRAGPVLVSLQQGIKWGKSTDKKFLVV